MSKNIKNIKLVVGFAAKMGTVIGEVRQDGKITIADIRSLVDVFQGLTALLDLEFSDILPEFYDLTDAERSEIVAQLKQELDLPDDELERKIEQFFDLAVRFESFVSEAVKIYKSGN